MAKRNRDYKAEYARRIALGEQTGRSRSQARGHRKISEKAIAPQRQKTPDRRRLGIAISQFNKGRSLTASAREAGITPEAFSRYLREAKIARKQRGRWILKKTRRVRMAIFSDGSAYHVIVDQPKQRTLLARYLAAVSRMLETGDISQLWPFFNKNVIDADGKSHPLETDPNTLYALNQTHTFEEVYDPVV